MQFDKRYRTWLAYLQVPMTRSADGVKLVGYNKTKLIALWKRADKLQSFFFVWCLIQSIFVMSCSATSYAIIVSHKYRSLFSPEFFWTLLVVMYLPVLGSTEYLVHLLISKDTNLQTPPDQLYLTCGRRNYVLIDRNPANRPLIPDN